MSYIFNFHEIEKLMFDENVIPIYQCNVQFKFI